MAICVCVCKFDVCVYSDKKLFVYIYSFSKEMN